MTKTDTQERALCQIALSLLDVKRKTLYQTLYWINIYKMRSLMPDKTNSSKQLQKKNLVSDETKLSEYPQKEEGLVPDNLKLGRYKKRKK